MEYSKAVRKRMRELVGVAYERELRLEMEKLSAQFELWQERKIDTFELEDQIHRFHNGVARKLYERYNELKPEMILPYALYSGLISEKDCPEEIVGDLRGRIKVMYEY